MPDDAVTPFDRAFLMLEDDAFRTGGAVPYSAVLRLAEKFLLGAEEVVALRRQLAGAGVQIDGDPDPPEDDEQALDSDRPTAAAIASAAAYEEGGARYRLLTPSEETALMRRIRAGEDAATLLLAGRADPSGALARVRQDGVDARDRFITANLRLVSFVANGFSEHPGGLTRRDLEQEGNLGLLRAIETFDHTRGFKFSTYAVWWIRQAIARAQADKDSMVRVPVYLHDLARRVRKLRRNLTSEAGGRPPSTRELADHVGLPPEKVAFLLDLHRSAVSLDAPRDRGEAPTLGETMVSTTTPDPYEGTFQRERRRELKAILGELKPREQEVIQYRFDEEMTLRAIGAQFGLTHERIRQIESRALLRLREPSRFARLAALLDVVPTPDDEEPNQTENAQEP